MFVNQREENNRFYYTSTYTAAKLCWVQLIYHAHGVNKHKISIRSVKTVLLTSQSLFKAISILPPSRDSTRLFDEQYWAKKKKVPFLLVHSYCSKLFHNKCGLGIIQSL